MTTLAASLARALAEHDAAPVALIGDDAWSNRDPDGPAVAAAVLVAFVDRAEPTVILTRRTQALRNHAGQVAFPGGRIDPGEDAIVAALREAVEEIALPRTAADVVGTGPTYLTGTNFHVTPVIVTVPPDLDLRPNPAEVASVFEIRADILFDPANREPQESEWEGAIRRYFRIIGHDETVWGATAGMVINLAARLGLDREPARFNRVLGSGTRA